MSLANFGILSLLDLMCVTEMAIDRRTSMQCTHVSEPELPTSGGNRYWPWIRADEPLSVIIAAAQEYYGARTLGDILRADLSRLIRAAGLDQVADRVCLPSVAPPLASDIMDKLTVKLRNLTSTEGIILHERLLSDDAITLDQLGNKTALSRERVRQLEKKLKTSLDEAVGSAIGILSDVAKDRIGPIASELELESHITAVIGVHDCENRTARLAHRMIRIKLEYLCQEGTCLSREAVQVAASLRGAATDVADDVGLVCEDNLLAILPSPEWIEHLPTLIDRSGLHSLSGHLALRATAKARAKAALISIGRSATKEEIGNTAGLDPARVASHLSGIRSVARADKVRWGLRDWIDDVYEGIPAEIIQRIEEDGGSTRLNRLLDELPRLFGVNEMSVRAYVATPAFRVEHGWVSIADEPDCVIGRFRDVASGRNSDDDPFWTFAMHERYLRGFSIVGVPPELAVELGCSFGGKTTVAVREPTACRPVSVNWRKTALTGPEIGRVVDAIRAIGAREGDLICLVVHSQHEVSLSLLESMTNRQDMSVGTEHPTAPLRSIGDSFPSAEGPYIGVRTGTPIAARLATSSRPSTPGDQDARPKCQPPTTKQ